MPPPGATDGHMDIVDPAGRFPLAEWLAGWFADPATREQALVRTPERLSGFGITGR